MVPNFKHLLADEHFELLSVVFKTEELIVFLSVDEHSLLLIVFFVYFLFVFEVSQLLQLKLIAGLFLLLAMHLFLQLEVLQSQISVAEGGIDIVEVERA